MTLTFDKPGSLERADSDWVRDEGRPLIKPDPDWTPEQTQDWLARPGTKDGERPYTRVTTFGEALLDGTMLAKWKIRRALIGMSRRPDYVVTAAALTVEDRDKAALNDLGEKCIEASGPNAADIGTALHGFSERIDRGEPIGFVPPEYRADLERYREVVEAHLTWVRREDRMVCDALEVAGTPDGIALCDKPDPDGVTGLLRIVDLKTGNIQTTAGKFSCQLGIYAHSALYDPATGTRTWLEELDTRWGLVLHMPAGAGTAELRWLNLEHGWLGAQIAGPVRRWRTVNHADLMRPLVPVERTVTEGMCRGVKRDGEPCGYKAKGDGLCTRHQGQDPDAVRPVRVTEMAAELEEAVANVPEPLRVGELTAWAGRMVAGAPSTSVDEAVDDDAIAAEIDAAEAENWGADRPLTKDDLPPEMRETEDDQRHAMHGTIGMDEHAYEPVGDPTVGAYVCAICGGDSEDHEQPVELNGNPVPHTSMPDPETAREAAERAEVALMDQIRACRTAGELQTLYDATGQAWTANVRGYASRHRKMLPELAQAERVDAALMAAIGAAGNLTELRRLFTDPRNVELITDEHKAAAKARAAELPPF